MKPFLIVLAIVAAGGLLIWWGIKTKSLPKILSGVITILGGILGGAIKRNSDLRKEVRSKDAEISARKEAVKEVKDVQQKIKEIDKDTSARPETKDAPASGESSSRLDRLNRL